MGTASPPQPLDRHVLWPKEGLPAAWMLVSFAFFLFARNVQFAAAGWPSGGRPRENGPING